MAGPFDVDHAGTRMSLSQPTSPPPPQPVFSRPGTGPRPTPAPQVSGSSMGAGGNSMPATQGVPTNDEIEAKIQAAMSSAAARSPANPPRDTRTQLFVGNLPYRVRWQDLKDLFRRSGTVLRADVSLGPDNRSRGYGTVLLATAEDAGRAMDMFNGYVWQTRTLEVRPDRMGLAGGVGMGLNGSGTGAGSALAGDGGDLLGGFSTPGFGAGANGSAGIGVGLDSYGISTLGGASGLGGLGGMAARTASTSGASTPFVGSRLGSTSPFLTSDDSASLAAQLARVASPSSVAAVGVSLNSPLLASAGNGISLSSPRSTHSQLTSAHTGGERSRNLFVGNLPFHIQWQDLKDLFRQAGTILRADVALGPDGRSRGFGTVSYATEADAEKAVRMFNGYDFNGRQLKVHFDKFAAPSVTAVPLAGLSMSAPQSPHSSTFASPHPSFAHTASFAQQILVQQQQRLDQQRHEQQRQDLLNPLAAFQRANTDQVAYKFMLPTDDNSRPTNYTFDGAPNPLMRARSDSVTQLLHTQPPLTQTALPPRHAEPQGDISAHTLQPPSSLHISLPSYQSAYAYDFSPGAQYGYDLYRMGQAQSEAVAGADMSHTPNYSLERDVMQQGSSLETRREAEPSQLAQEPASSHVPSSNQDRSRNRPPATQPGTSSGSGSDQQGSQSSSTQNSQPATQAASPTSAGSGGHSHPAHPGPIALPPPVMAFTMPPSLSPIYHPQMSPYASPLNHPGMMMGMGMTPYGLPPITPSMPSFQFVPQPSPGPAPSGGSTDLLSPPGAGQPPMTPGGSMDPQAQAQGSYLHHLRQTHGPMLSPYTPFSPGVTMSPGAFWGRPGSGAPNPYINPAPGAPVHLPAGYFPPVAEEPQGYFPPFLPASSSSATMRPTGLSNEIGHDGSSTSGSGSGSGSEGGGNTVTTPQGGLVLEAAAAGPMKRPASAASEGTTAGTGARTGGSEQSPRPSSSNATSWPAESANPSPSGAAEREIEKRMLALSVDVGAVPCVEGEAEDVGARAPLAQPPAGAVHVMTRADSDPVLGSPVEGRFEAHERLRRPSVGEGRAVSDSVAA